MSNPEILAMLTPKSVRIGHVPGGIPSMTQMDVAAMMAKCSPCECSLLRAIHTKELGEFYRARAYWFTFLKTQGWTKNIQRVEVIANLTFDNYVNDPRCKSCNGTKGLIIDSKWVACDSCKGRGTRVLTDMEIARKLELTRLQSPWDERVSFARRRIHIWYCDAVKKLA